jgi:hypothetical protein
MVRAARTKDNGAWMAFDRLHLQFFTNYPKECQGPFKVCERGYATLYLYVKIAH